MDDIQVNFLIEATQAHSATRSLAAPRLTLYNGQRAYVTVATQQAYVADLTPVVAENAIAFNPVIGFVASGSVLDVEATVSADRRYVRLTVRPQVMAVNSFGRYAITTATTDAAGNPLTGTGFIQLPNVTVQRLETTVDVPDGGTLLLGGQRLSGEVEREMGVPLLNKIPIIKRAFANRGSVRDEQTLLILVKPKIIIHSEEEALQLAE
jgi:type II secretory pathway component GspD/PulD (secretin)